MGKTDEYGRFVAGEETASRRFYFVGRTLPVLRGKTGKYGRFTAGGKTVPRRFSFSGRTLPILQGKTGEEYRLSAGEKLYRVDLVLSAARSQFCKAKLASMVGL